jgi:hypothetical protein
MSAPSALALSASEVNVRTTPLTCGRQASVAIKIRPISVPPAVHVIPFTARLDKDVSGV